LSGTVFFVERGWECAGLAVVTLGVARVTIRSRRKVGGALVPRLRPESLRGSHIRIILFVNSLPGSAYGSTSLDCRHPLRNWVCRVATVQREKHAAAARAGRGLADADSGDGESGRGDCFASASS
jgi:hypothetical protein